MNPLIIGNTQIRRDVAGRYCLNDLHQASGGNNRHRPSLWLSNKQTKELVAELEAGIPASVAGIPATEAVSVESEGFSKGVYALKELVYSYAMWISPTFHLHVIRSYDAIVTQQLAAPPAIEPPLMPAVDHRADQLVSAGRIFNSALRTARAMRMPPARAMQAAFACTKRHTGIDWVDELDAGETIRLGAEPAPRDGIAARFVAAWQAGDLGVPFAPCLSMDAFAMFRQWCRREGLAPWPLPRFVNEVTRGGHLRQMRSRWSRFGQYQGPHGFLMPPLELCPSGVPMANWLGQCVEHFRRSMNCPAESVEA